MLKFSPFFKELIATGCNDGTVFIWDINAKAIISQFLMAHSSRVNAIAFSPKSESLLFSVSLDQDLHLFDIKQKAYKASHSFALL